MRCTAPGRRDCCRRRTARSGPAPDPRALPLHRRASPAHALRRHCRRPGVGDRRAGRVRPPAGTPSHWSELSKARRRHGRGVRGRFRRHQRGVLWRIATKLIWCLLENTTVQIGVSPSVYQHQCNRNFHNTNRDLSLASSALRAVLMRVPIRERVHLRRNALVLDFAGFRH